MLSTIAAIGFDPQIRGILVVATGAIMLIGTIWLLLVTNSGLRLGTLIALTGFFGWMVIMGGFWWVRGIGFVGDSVSFHVLDFNRGDISQSSVEPVRDLPDPDVFQGMAFQLAVDNPTEEGLAEFTAPLDRDSPDYAGFTDLAFAEAVRRNDLRNETITMSQLMSVVPDFVESSDAVPDLNGWEILSTADAGEAQSTAGSAIVEREGFDFDSQSEFKFLDAYRIGGKPRLSRDITHCNFCGDRWERISLWVTNSLRITNPAEYAVVQLRAIDEAALIVQEGQAPAFPIVDEDAPIISVVMIRDLGNLRFPPAIITLGSLIIFTTLAYLLHIRDLEAMARVKEFEEEG